MLFFLKYLEKENDDDEIILWESYAQIYVCKKKKTKTKSQCREKKTREKKRTHKLRHDIK